MPALNRTLTLAQVHNVAMLVGKQLDLDMAGVIDDFLKIDFLVAESRQGFGLSSVERRAQLVFTRYLSHALAPASGRGFQHHGIAKAGGGLARFDKGLQRFSSTRNHRHTRSCRGPARAGL